MGVTACMQCSFGLLTQVSGVDAAWRPSPSDRDYQLATVVVRLLWHVGGVEGEDDIGEITERRLPLWSRLRLIADHYLRRWQAGWTARPSPHAVLVLDSVGPEGTIDARDTI
jgi:hypothetical protein